METELENLLPFLSFLCFLKRNVGGPIWRSYPMILLNHVTERNKPETSQRHRLLANYFQQQKPKCHSSLLTQPSRNEITWDRTFVC